MTSTIAPTVRYLPLLIVEDSDEDFEAFMRFLRRYPSTIPIERCMNGEQALAFLYNTDRYTNVDHAPCPSMILLDLNLPGMDGREVLRRLKLDDKLKSNSYSCFYHVK